MVMNLPERLIPRSGIQIIMRQFALIILLPAAIGCLQQTPPVQSTVLVAIPLDSVADVRAAVAHASEAPRAIIFIHVHWSILHPHSTQFQEFVSVWHSAHPEYPVSFHRIDFTEACGDYAPITSLPGYSEWEQSAGRHPFGGNGEWAWIADGKLVDIDAQLGTSNAELLKRTENAFLKVD